MNESVGGGHGEGARTGADVTLLVQVPPQFIVGSESDQQEHPDVEFAAVVQQWLDVPLQDHTLPCAIGDTRIGYSIGCRDTRIRWRKYPLVVVVAVRNWSYGVILWGLYFNPGVSLLDCIVQTGADHDVPAPV